MYSNTVDAMEIEPDATEFKLCFLYINRGHGLAERRAACKERGIDTTGMRKEGLILAWRAHRELEAKIVWANRRRILSPIQ